MDDSKFPFDEKKDAGAGASDAGSVTSMFAAVDPLKTPQTATASETPKTTEDLLAELLKPKAAPAVQATNPAPVVQPPVAETHKPGEVTRMLEELKALTGAEAAPLQPAPVKPPTAPPVAASLAPGEFTQIFRQIPTPKPKAAPAAPAPSAPASTPASAPGEFTQFLQKMPGAGSGVAAENDVQPAAAPSAPGSFTQMFQTLSPGVDGASPAPLAPVASPPASSSGPGAFTQMFQTLSPDAGQTPEPQRASPLPPFGEPLKPVPPVPSQPPVMSAPSAPSNQGGFTQLFNSLSGSGLPQQGPAASAPPVDAPFSLPGAPAPQPLQGGAGEFTRLMRSLSDPPPAMPGSASPPMGPPVAQPMSQPLPQSGPGEYTRIISGSAMREAGGGGAPFPPMAPQAAPQQAAGGFAMPPVPRTPPHLAPPAMHPPAAGGFGMPQPFAPPALPAAAPAPQGKLQQYLPLILVVNGALLLIVVIVLVFALRHH